MISTMAVPAYGIIEWACKEKDESLMRSPQPWIRLGDAAVLLLLGFLCGWLNIGWPVTLVAAVLPIRLGLDVYLRLQRTEPEMAPITVTILIPE
jgi:hypothetical protein